MVDLSIGYPMALIGDVNLFIIMSIHQLKADENPGYFLGLFSALPTHKNFKMEQKWVNNVTLAEEWSVNNSSSWRTLSISANIEYLS
jgi:hypothetical protein